MRLLRALSLYILLVFLGGAWLAPLLWEVAQLGVHWFPKMAQAPFHRYMDRSFLILALVGLGPLLKALGAASITDMGLSAPEGQQRHLLGGFAVGFGSLAVLAVIVIVGGGRTLVHDVTAHKLIMTVVGGMVTAVVVATLEEILFRGGIFGGLKQILHWQFALLVSSLIYALVHFLQRAELVGAVHWYSGLFLLPQMLSGFIDVRVLIPTFFNLTLVGILLGLAYQRTNALYFSIGMHAGWIFWLKTYGAFTAPNPKAMLWLWGSGRLIDGWLATVVLMVLLLGFRFICPRQKNAPYSY